MPIHPTAIVSPTAQIGQDVEIGPYCIVGDHVQLGDGCWLQHHVSISGPSEIGPRNKFYAFSSIGQQSQDLKYTQEPTHLKIGSDNTFREFSTVNRGTNPGDYTRVGNHGHFLAYTHIAHDCTVGDHCIFSNNGTLAGHVEVGNHVILGGFSAVHQFCRLGDHSITGGCTKIVQDVAPFYMVDGHPALSRGLNLVGLQRNGFSEADVRELKLAYRALHLRDQVLTTAAAELAATSTNTFVKQLAGFFLSTKRGVTLPQRRRKGQSTEEAG